MSLFAEDLLQKVYESFQGEEICLPRKAMPEIADDSDYHRTNIGYACYQKAKIISIEGKEWVLSYGNNYEGYPAKEYLCDIVAIKVAREKDKKAEGIFKKLLDNHYFCHSLIYARHNGKLSVKQKGDFGQVINEKLSDKIKNFTAQDLQIDQSLTSTIDFEAVVKSPVKYKPEFVPFLTEVFYEILNTTGMV